MVNKHRRMNNQGNKSKNNNKIPVLSYQIDQKIKNLILSSFGRYIQRNVDREPFHYNCHFRGQ